MSLGNHPAADSCGNREKEDGNYFQGKRKSGGLSASSAEDLLGHCPKTKLLLATEVHSLYGYMIERFFLAEEPTGYNLFRIR